MSWGAHRRGQAAVLGHEPSGWPGLPWRSGGEESARVSAVASGVGGRYGRTAVAPLRPHLGSHYTCDWAIATRGRWSARAEPPAYACTCGHAAFDACTLAAAGGCGLCGGHRHVRCSACAARRRGGSVLGGAGRQAMGRAGGTSRRASASGPSVSDGAARRYAGDRVLSRSNLRARGGRTIAGGHRVAEAASRPAASYWPGAKTCSRPRGCAAGTCRWILRACCSAVSERPA